MRTLEIVTVVGIVAVVVLFLVYRKRRSLDAVEDLLAKRRGSSRLSTRAFFAQGRERMSVALSLSESQLFYENADFLAELELGRLDEVEYDDELSTATPEVSANERVLRLRSHGQTFEFILPRQEADKMAALLPSHRADEPGQVRVV